MCCSKGEKSVLRGVIIASNIIQMIGGMVVIGVTIWIAISLSHGTKATSDAHFWVNVTIFSLLVLVGISGIVLVYKDDARYYCAYAIIQGIFLVGVIIICVFSFMVLNPFGILFVILALAQIAAIGCAIRSMVLIRRNTVINDVTV